MPVFLFGGKMKNIFIIAGETSGDKHAARLVHAMKNKFNHQIQFVGIGGDLLAREGVELIEHIKNISFLGLWEVLKNLSKIKALFKKTREKIIQIKPDAIILVDYPGFNLKIAKFAKKRGIPVIYYICPQIWAWGERRVKKMKQIIDLFLVILPFEKGFYSKYGINAHFIGHPSLESAIPSFEQNQFKQKFNIPLNKKIIGLFPGSRAMEVRTILPVMIDAAKRLYSKYPDVHFVLSAINYVDWQVYDSIVTNNDTLPLTVVKNYPYDIMNISNIIWVASGTASLEAGLFQKPTIVLYKVNPITYFIGKKIVKVEFISLTNLILKESVFPELIQKECKSSNIWAITDSWLSDPEQIKIIKMKLSKLKKLITDDIASEKASNIIYEFFQKRSK